MSETEDPVEQAAAPELAPLPMRVVQIFFSPVRLFQGLRLKPVAWGAILLGALIASAANFLIPADLFEEMVRNQLVEAGQPIPENIEMMGTIGRIGSGVGALIFFPILTLASAGLFSLIFLFGLGFEGSFKQYLAVGAHAGLIVAVAALCLTPLRILSGNVQFTLSLGTLLPFLGDSLPGRFLNLLDLFALWTVALVGVGAAVVDGKKGFSGAAAVSVGTILLVLLVLASFGLGAPPS